MKLKKAQHQVVVVMGASSGIGRATALCFARRGAKVVCAARSECGLATLVDQIRKEGGVAFGVVADVADFEQVRSVADRAVAEFGRLDTWVHLSAVTVYATVEQTTPAEFRRVLEVNLLGQIHGALAALPHLRCSGRGALIHVSSVEGKIAQPLQGAYAASKHGIVGFLDALRMELRREGIPISVTNVMPPGINTPLFDNALTRLGVMPRPPGPVYDPEIVARGIVHAAEHPMRTLVPGGAAVAGLLAKRISPRLVDALSMRVGFTAQLTDKPKSSEAPNNLFVPIESPFYHRIRGDFGDESRSFSLATWVQTTRLFHLSVRVGQAAISALAAVGAALYTTAYPKAREIPRSATVD